MLTRTDTDLTPNLNAIWSLRLSVVGGWTPGLLWPCGSGYHSSSSEPNPTVLGVVLDNSQQRMWIALAQGVDYRSQAWSCVCPWSLPNVTGSWHLETKMGAWRGHEAGSPTKPSTLFPEFPEEGSQ